jgi:chaperonin GroEL
LYASKTIENLKGENFDQTTGISIVRKALSVPCKTIVENAGKEGGIIAANLLA